MRFYSFLAQQRTNSLSYQHQGPHSQEYTEYAVYGQCKSGSICETIFGAVYFMHIRWVTTTYNPKKIVCAYIHSYNIVSRRTDICGHPLMNILLGVVFFFLLVQQIMRCIHRCVHLLGHMLFLMLTFTARVVLQIRFLLCIWGSLRRKKEKSFDIIDRKSTIFSWYPCQPSTLFWLPAHIQ